MQPDMDEWPPDVVLCDLAMPDADGFDLLHWIRASAHERVRGIPVVAVPAFAMPEDRDRASEAGFEGFPGQAGRAVAVVDGGGHGGRARYTEGVSCSSDTGSS
ncbi:MAG TPA: response regulator [Thermoanaerobaculia bacterium]|jgi:CheY-like chemotaxis protein